MSFRINDMGSTDIPKARGKHVPYGSLTEAFSGMIVGQCLELSGLDKKGIASARVGSINIGKKIGFKFTTRTIDGVLHVWRVA